MWREAGPSRLGNHAGLVREGGGKREGECEGGREGGGKGGGGDEGWREGEEGVKGGGSGGRREGFPVH